MRYPQTSTNPIIKSRRQTKKQNMLTSHSIDVSIVNVTYSTRNVSSLQVKNQKNVTKQQASDTHVKLTTIHINYF